MLDITRSNDRQVAINDRRLTIDGRRQTADDKKYRLPFAV